MSIFYNAKTVPGGKHAYGSIKSLFCFSMLTILSFLTIVLPGAEAGIVSSPKQHVASNQTDLPAIDGQVIYRHNEGGLNHLYIVGISHRDTLTRSNGSKTAQVQSEVYRIGEWLINNKGIELILPEGYFTTMVENETSPGTSEKGLKKVSFNSAKLEEKLKTDIYCNAERLLVENHPLTVRQVEDERLYNDVVAKIGALGKNGDAFDFIYDKLELDYLQERRTAAILQNITGIIDHQIRGGHIRHRNAMLTIGVSHLSQIIASLKQKQLVVRSPAFTPFKDYVSEVNLVKEGFDITIIIPRTIADDDDLLSLTKLAHYAGRLPEIKTTGLER